MASSAVKPVIWVKAGFTERICWSASVMTMPSTVLWNTLAARTSWSSASLSEVTSVTWTKKPATDPSRLRSGM